MQPNARAKRPAANVLAAIANTHWMITEEYLRTIVEVAARENLSLEAIEARFGQPLDNTRTVTVRDGVATIPIVGPMFRRADFFTPRERRDHVRGDRARPDRGGRRRSVRAILLAMDTPGGEVNGAHETAQLIAQVRGVKPIEAQVSGIGASAAYLLASATERITTGEMGILGSLGVLFTHRDSRERDQKLGVKTMHIVSSQSPKKHLDPTEDAGRAEMQAVADQMAHAFLSTVARESGREPRDRARRLRAGRGVRRPGGRRRRPRR
jgi:ClpP class serine protease